MRLSTSGDFNERNPKKDLQTRLYQLLAYLSEWPSEDLNNKIGGEDLIQRIIERPSERFNNEFGHGDLIQRIINCIVTSDITELIKRDSTALYEAGRREIATAFRESFPDEEWESLKREMPKLLEPFLLDLIKTSIHTAYIMGATHHVCTSQSSDLQKEELKSINSPSVVYDSQRIWGKPDGSGGWKNDWRPYEEVTITGPKGSVRVWCLVDTGADKLQIDSAFAQTIGLNLQTQSGTSTVMTAGGGTIQVSEIMLDVQIENKQKQTGCLFAANSMPLLGRDTILNFLEIGFDKKGWLLKE